MDNRRLIELVKQSPQIWDRNCPLFRDNAARKQAWDDLALKMGLEVNTCKDTFKSLREKYLREREKAHHQAGQCSPWELLSDLNFLDPHIVPRATVWHGDSTSEDDISIESDSDPIDFDRQLIQMVKKAAPIWNRNSNAYPNKMSKDQLWQNISSGLQRDMTSCMLRWKALREKYIRQKAKFQEGEAKWELLDDLGFLDKVIQYRKRPSDFTPDSSKYQPGNNSFIRCNMDVEDYTYTDSSSDFVKEETTIQQVADSSFNTTSCKKPREDSIGSFDDTNKINAKEESVTAKEKTPEQLFGDLVASLLNKKPENQRNLYMIDIITCLTK